MARARPPSAPTPGPANPTEPPGPGRKNEPRTNASSIRRKQPAPVSTGNSWLWTRPIESSPYPLAWVPAGTEPRDSTIRLMGGAMAVLLLSAYVIVTPTINSAVTYVGYWLNPGQATWAEYTATASSFGTVWGVLGAHLGLAAMALVVWVLFRFFNHRRAEWLWSVSPGVRWRYGFLCFLAALIIVGAVAVYHWVTGPGWAALPGWGWYALVLVVTTPLQALAEEVMFRGYLMQALGSIVRNVWFPILASAVIFAVFHGMQNPWLFGSRLVFGILAGILVWRTGGLEASIAIHVVNNLCAFGLALLTGTLSQVRETTAVPWTQSVSDVVMFAVCAVACWGIALGLRVPMKAGKVAP